MTWRWNRLKILSPLRMLVPRPVFLVVCTETKLPKVVPSVPLITGYVLLGERDVLVVEAMTLSSSRLDVRRGNGRFARLDVWPSSLVREVSPRLLSRRELLVLLRCLIETEMFIWLWEIVFRMTECMEVLYLVQLCGIPMVTLARPWPMFDTLIRTPQWLARVVVSLKLATSPTDMG